MSLWASSESNLIPNPVKEPNHVRVYGRWKKVIYFSTLSRFPFPRSLPTWPPTPRRRQTADLYFALAWLLPSRGVFDHDISPSQWFPVPSAPGPPPRTDWTDPKGKSIFSKRRRVGIAWNILLHNPENTTRELTFSILHDEPAVRFRISQTFRNGSHTPFGLPKMHTLFFFCRCFYLLPFGCLFPPHSPLTTRQETRLLLASLPSASSPTTRSLAPPPLPLSTYQPFPSSADTHNLFYSGGGQNDVITLKLPAMEKTRNWKLFHRKLNENWHCLR